MMKTKNEKIRAAAQEIAELYLNTVREGRTPAILRAWFAANRYDYFRRVGDQRYNFAETLETLYLRTHHAIKRGLAKEPELGKELVRMRAEEEQRRAEESAGEWKESHKVPFPLFEN